MKTDYREYRSVRDDIQDGDLLLFRRAGLTGAAIAAVSRSIYSHVGVAAWWGQDLMCVETREWFGGRAVLLSTLVEQYPGRIHVYEPEIHPSHREAIVSAMRRHAGKRYGWATIAWHVWRSLPVVRWFVRAPVDDAANGSPLVCSSLVSRVYRQAGYDPCKNLSDQATTPGDLSRSTLFQYRWTLA